MHQLRIFKTQRPPTVCTFHGLYIYIQIVKTENIISKIEQNLFQIRNLFVFVLLAELFFLFQRSKPVCLSLSVCAKCAYTHTHNIYLFILLVHFVCIVVVIQRGKHFYTKFCTPLYQKHFMLTLPQTMIKKNDDRKKRNVHTQLNRQKSDIFILLLLSFSLLIYFYLCATHKNEPTHSFRFSNGSAFYWVCVCE